MASSAGGIGPEDGGGEMQEQSSLLDWMLLDSSHVNVSLWSHFDGRQSRSEEQGFRDLDEPPQQSSSLDWSLLSSYGENDPLRRFNGRRTLRVGEQEIGDRREGIQGRLDTDCVDPSDITMGLSGTLNDLSWDAHYPNTSAGSIQDDPPSWTSSSAALSINEYHGQPTEYSRSIFDESDYNHIGRQAPRDDYGPYLHRFEMGYECPYVSDRPFQIHPALVYKPLDDGLVIANPQPMPRILHCLSPNTRPDNRQRGLGELGEERHADASPFQFASSPQHVKGRLRPEAPRTSSSTQLPEGPFICQRCNYPRRFNREVEFRRHMARRHPTRKVWITVDISPDKLFLASCKACRTGKKYERYSSAAAHLSEDHFYPPRGRPSIQNDQGSEHQFLHLEVRELASKSRSAADECSNSRHKKQGAHPETRRSATDNRYRQSITTTDQVLARHPKHQEMANENWPMASNRSANSIQSVDSGYISDVTRLDCNQMTERDRNPWSRSVHDGNLFVKDEPIDPGIDVKVFPPKEESGNCRKMEFKQESSRTLDENPDIREWQECASKGEPFTIRTDPSTDGYENGDLASVKSDLNLYQQCFEQRNLKRKRDSYLPSAVPVISAGHKSESFPSTAVKTSYANYDGGSAKLKFNKRYHAKDGVCTMKAESDSVDASSVTAAPLISFNLEPSHPKHRNTLPIPFGHPKSRQWTEMLPSIKACTREIMGKGNGGALELFLVNGEPTICITCWDPHKLNLVLVRSCMEPLGLRINVTQGKIQKSASDGHDWPAISPMPDQGQCMFPSIHGHYMQRPTCGASLGTADGPLKTGKVSLGGYLKIKHLYRRHWSYYTMTVHHILVSDDQKEPPLYITGNDEDEEMAEPGYDHSPGVCNGVYDVGDGPSVRVSLSCPAVPDAESLVARLEGRRIKRCANENYATIDNLDNLDDLLNKVCTRESTKFGNAAWSSGLCLDQDVEMDWLLIGDLPMDRIDCNKPGDVTAYMEGNHQDSMSTGCWTPSAYVDESAFSTLMNFSAQERGKPGSEGGYLSRVFGRGSETGLADGFLSPHPSIFYDETYGPYDAWAFTPRYTYGLGDSGDSGTWIFTSEGKLLGQIISYNRARHITYFTPICKIFKHIKRITGATDVELLTPEDVTENPRVTPRSAGGLLSPDAEPFDPNNCPTSTATDIRASNALYSTAGLSTPGSTQASDSSD